MKDRPANHLLFLDGIRGLSALYVILDHAYSALFYAGIGEHGGLARLIMAILRPLAFGRYAVDMFIVLSGYCLMLPVTRSAGVLRGGFRGYIKRRAWRIIPPYYAALALSLLILVVCQFFLPSPGVDGEGAAKLPGAGDLLTHVLLVHNLVNKWAHTINSPMWSVASEWQIYFLFPALLLPVWKRGGITAAVVVAFAFGYAVYWLVPGGLDGAAPWFVGLFALGMAAATFDFSHPHAGKSLGEKVPWGTLFLGLVGALAVAGTLSRGWFRTHAWAIDPIFGFAAMSLLLYCGRAMSRSGPDAPPLPLRILGSRWAVALGAFSYSLYLIHYPLLKLFSASYQQFAPPPTVQIAVTFGVSVPLTIGLAYAFHLAFERPFMPGRPRTIREAEVAAEVSPAP